MLGALLDTQDVTAADLAVHLDGLDVARRVTECIVLSASQQKRLWELATAAAHPIVGDLLSDMTPGATAVFAGRNSLRAFTRFDKWFARQGSAIVGCNMHTLSWVVGPGYFTVAEGSGAGLMFDYQQLPSSPPDGWPKVTSNSRWFSRPVYGDLLDRVVWASPDVLIGAAFGGGAPSDSYFVLARIGR